MYKLKYLILIIIVILGLGCSKREEKGGSSASNIKLSDIELPDAYRLTDVSMSTLDKARIQQRVENLLISKLSSNDNKSNHKKVYQLVKKVIAISKTICA